MKKYLLILFIILPIIGFSQLKKNSFVIGLEGNFTKKQSSLGGFSNNFSTNIKGGNISVTIGYRLTKKIEIGLGVNYYSDKTTTQSQFNQINIHQQIEESVIKSNLIMPKLYFKYGQQLIHNMYLSGNIQFGYGKLDREYKSVTASVKNINSNDINTFEPNQVKLLSRVLDKTTNVFSAKFHPEIEYYINSRFGFSLKLGGISYIDNDQNNSENSININFNPNNWLLGFKVNL